MCHGFVYDGVYSPYRRRLHGNSCTGINGEQFVVALQTHDQVANASRGQRLSTFVSFEDQRVAAAVLLCAPYIPLLFMGQEYGETAPFHYFTSHQDCGLAEAVREGRRREFSGFGSGFADPQASETFLASKIDWRRRDREPHRSVLRCYRELLALRRRHPALAHPRKDMADVTYDESNHTLTLERWGPAGDRVTLRVDFAAGSFDFSSS